MTAVFLAVQSEYACNLNKLLFSVHPLMPLLIMPAGFSTVAFLSARYFSGTSGSGIPQAIAALNEAGARKRRNLLSLHIVVGKIMPTRLRI